MAIKTRIAADGSEVLWIVLNFRNRKTNAREKFRRDAQVQTRAAAKREENSVIHYWEEHGTILPLLKAPETAKVEEPEPVEVNTWADAVQLYAETYALTLKPSTRAGYKEILESALVTAWDGLDILALSQEEARLVAWDGELFKAFGDSRRRNFHVAVRTVFRVAEDAGWHSGLVKFKTGDGKRGRSLPHVGEKAIHATNPEDVEALLGESDEGVCGAWVAARRASRFAFALCAYAGLRASEVRALKWKHVDLRRGVLNVSEATCFGETSTTKSGNERSVTIPQVLLDRMAAQKKLVVSKPDDLVAPSVRGTAWSDKALYHALVRAVARLGLDKTRVHALRHYFVTTMFAHGANPRVVQKLVGHSSLDVTMRYADATAKGMADAVSVFDRPKLVVIPGGKASTG